jgi:hypothetical protein
MALPQPLSPPPRHQAHPDTESVPMPRIDKSELVSGLVVVTIGAYFVLGALDYRMGTVTRMGPGFVPYHVGLITMALGALIVLGAFGRDAPFPRLDWRGMIFVGASVVCFGLLLPRAGLIPAAMGTVMVASFASPSLRLPMFPVLASAVAGGAWVIFVKLLGLSIPVLRNPF